MPFSLRVLLLAAVCSLPALAWEPASPAAVQARIDELQQAWANKTPDEVLQDKIKRSRQPRPQWVTRSAWKMELGPVTYYFAVGKAGFTPAVAADQNATTTSSNPPGRPLDWWYDDVPGLFYTLVVDAR